MTPEDIIAHFGTASVAARKLGVTHAAISIWKRTGYIPIGRQALIQLQTSGRLRADRPETVPTIKNGR